MLAGYIYRCMQHRNNTNVQPRGNRGELKNSENQHFHPNLGYHNSANQIGNGIDLKNQLVIEKWISTHDVEISGLSRAVTKRPNLYTIIEICISKVVYFLGFTKFLDIAVQHIFIVSICLNTIHFNSLEWFNAMVCYR